MSDSCVACFTITSLAQIPVQVSKWLAVCETNAGSTFKCVITDVQILSANKALRLLVVYDERDPLVMRVPGWAEAYTPQREKEALATVPIPAWAGSVSSARASTVLHLSSAKHLAEILLTLFIKCRQINVPDRSSLISCFTSNMAKMAHDDPEKCAMMPRPLTESQLDSILELADQWKSAFAEQVRLGLETRRLEREIAELRSAPAPDRKGGEREVPWAGSGEAVNALSWLPSASERPSFLPLATHPPTEAGSRISYLHCNEWPTLSAICAHASAWRGQGPSDLKSEPTAPFVPKINVADQAKLGMVVYLGPTRAQRVWYPWSYALRAPLHMAALPPV